MTISLKVRGESEIVATLVKTI